MILSIDPATSSCGFALFYPDGTLFDAGHVTSSGSSYSARFEIVIKLDELVKRFSPTILICEEPKLGGRFQTNSQTGMDKLLGQIEYWALKELSSKLPIYYFHPMTIKSIVGGSGKASKLDVAMGCGEYIKTAYEQNLLASLILVEDFDATDAVAVGLTYLKKEEK